MKLPEPAGTVWRTHRRTLHAFARAETSPSRLMLGGGTILAARLGHRRSSDIDIFLPDIEDLADWRPGGPLDLERATGGKLAGQRPNRIVIRLTAESSLDVAATRPKLGGGETLESIDGEPETVLSNAQIILGKLYRTDRSVTRDAFDIVSVAKGDPEALRIAVNALNPGEARIVRSNLFTSNDRMAGEASKVLLATNPEYSTDLRNLGRNASFAVNAHRYERVRIVAAGGRLRVERRTKAEPVPPVHTHEAKAVAAGLRRTGTDRYLAANAGIAAPRAADELQRVAAAGWEGVAFDSADDKPYERLASALDEAERRKPRHQPGPGDAAGRPDPRR